jgi:hypothetical protein
MLRLVERERLGREPDMTIRTRRLARSLQMPLLGLFKRTERHDARNGGVGAGCRCL